MMSFKAGQILAATPRLTDAGFARSVILVLSSDEQCTMAVKLTAVLDEHCPAFLDGCKVFDGGPVNRAIIALHTVDQEVDWSVPVGDTGYLATTVVADGGGRAQPDEVAHSERNAVFVGYCCWRPDQFTTEVISGDWAVSDVRLETLMTVPAGDRWRLATRCARLERESGATKTRH